MAVTPSQAAVFAWIAVIAPSLSGWLAGIAAGRGAPVAPGTSRPAEWCWEPPPWDCSCACSRPLPAAAEPPPPPPSGPSAPSAPGEAQARDAPWPPWPQLVFPADAALVACFGFGIFEVLLVLYWCRRGTRPELPQRRVIHNGARLGSGDAAARVIRH